MKFFGYPSRNLARYFVMLLIAAVSLSCSQEKDGADEHTWTLSSGVEVLQDSGCQNATGRPVSVDVKKEEIRYVVAVEIYQSCQSKAIEPWLTQTRNGKATLVIQPNGKDSSASCECSRSLKVAISNRLEKGNTLFVVANSEVLGYAELK